LTSAKSCRNFS